VTGRLNGISQLDSLQNARHPRSGVRGPLVASLLAAGDCQATEDDAMTMTWLPGINLILGIPAAIVTIMRPLPPACGVSKLGYWR
jgi:hypothetical protein